MRHMTARFWSIALVLTSVVISAAVVLMAHHHIQVNYISRGLPVQGWGVAVGFMMLIPITSLICLVGVVLGIIAYRKLPPPRPLSRKLELAALPLPILLWILLAYPLFLWVRG